MLIKNYNNLNILFDKKLELILALYAVYLKKHPELKEEYDFIEFPPVVYVEELENLINIEKCNELIKYLEGFNDCSLSANIAIGLTNDFEIDYERIDYEYIKKYMSYGTLEEFVRLLKKLANEIKWDEFINQNKEYYVNLVNRFSDFPANLDLNDIKKYYGNGLISYNYIPSILMNGGFGTSNKLGDAYYIRGIQFYDKTNDFHYDPKYLLECMFHEFSHPLINPIIDKYFDKFTNIDEIFKEAIKNGLPKCYSQNQKTLLYEYFVRTNAYILTLKYYQEIDIEWIKEHGFIHLDEIIEFTLKNRSKYETYEEFFVEEMIDYFNNILNDTKNNDKQK